MRLLGMLTALVLLGACSSGMPYRGETTTDRWGNVVCRSNPVVVDGVIGLGSLAFITSMGIYYFDKDAGWIMGIPLYGGLGVGFTWSAINGYRKYRRCEQRLTRQAEDRAWYAQASCFVVGEGLEGDWTGQLCGTDQAGCERMRLDVVRAARFGQIPQSRLVVGSACSVPARAPATYSCLRDETSTICVAGKACEWLRALYHNHLGDVRWASRCGDGLPSSVPRPPVLSAVYWCAPGDGGARCFAHVDVCKQWATKHDALEAEPCAFQPHAVCDQATGACYPNRLLCPSAACEWD
jgi:hypothetical protein